MRERVSKEEKVGEGEGGLARKRKGEEVKQGRGRVREDKQGRVKEREGEGAVQQAKNIGKVTKSEQHQEKASLKIHIHRLTS